MSPSSGERDVSALRRHLCSAMCPNLDTLIPGQMIAVAKKF